MSCPPCGTDMCAPWVMPEGCCDACQTEDSQELLEEIWCAVSEWLHAETCFQFPGLCIEEVEVCPPCQCVCACGCGPWAQIPLRDAFCKPIHLDDGCSPCLEFVFPDGDGDGGEVVVGPDDGVWTLNADLLTVDWCGPAPGGGGCAGFWPPSDFCGDRWKMRAVTGCEPPKMLLWGAARFACEMLKECQGADSCLPDGVRSITRRGLTMDTGPEIAETIEFETQGTGIPTLDLALRKWGCDSMSLVAAHIDPLKGYRGACEPKGWEFRQVLAPTAPTVCEL